MSTAEGTKRAWRHRRPTSAAAPATALRPAATWRGRLRQHTRCDKGVSLLEAAVATPLFFMLIFATFEISMAMKDYLATTSSVRAAARSLSASGNDKTADQYTLLALSRESTALKRADIERIVVYKPVGFGEKPSTDCMNGLATVNVCNVYTAADFTKAQIQTTEETAAAAENRSVDPSKVFFGCGSTAVDRYWCPTNRKVTTNGSGTEFVGVWMKVNHHWITGMFGSEKDLTDQSVIRLEPRPE